MYFFSSSIPAFAHFSFQLPATFSEAVAWASSRPTAASSARVCPPTHSSYLTNCYNPSLPRHQPPVVLPVLGIHVPLKAR